MKWHLVFLGEAVLRGKTPVDVDMAAGGSTSCYQESDKGASYNGLLAQTADGQMCKDGTYCRNSDSSESKPWCHPTNAPEEKSLCAVPVCTATGIYARDFHDEAESLKTTVESRDCQCADELYGSTTTTRDTRVVLAQDPCKC